MSFKSYDIWFKIGILLLGLYIIIKVTPIYFPIILAMILAFILNPLVNYITNIRFGPQNRHIGRGISVICAFLILILFLLVVGTFVLLPFIHEFDKFIIDLPNLISKIQNIAIKIQQRAQLLDLPANINTFIEQAIASAASFSADLARRILQAAFGFASSIVELVVVPVLAYYFLKDWSILKDKIVSLFTVESRERVRKIIEEMSLVISAYIRGQVIISIIIGIFVFSGMYMLGVDYPLVLGLLAACTESIPIIGPIIGSVPAIMLAYLISPTLAFKVIIFYILVQLIENQIVVPNIMGHTIDLHPVVIIISLLIGGQLWGIIGMMLAVPVAALLRVLIRQLWITNER
ncbi:AI-2E family transporter [Pelosinus propionicus]|uniref:Predicted PurR-regulated permease PerM n=1 Tax=Pelosinus propionicus DSM 13327 TaxID=1123291 RepID=A0A1I4KSF5_9FIRM|nr:AI-2E family transporter [Pelosinus propionicus]SFL81724.1 Predicted PurR-regulated permease PerM [Pelosinus propionicus DSM 13327]